MPSSKWTHLTAIAVTLAGALMVATPARAEMFQFSTDVSINPVGTTPTIPPATISTITEDFGSPAVTYPAQLFDTGGGNGVALLALNSNGVTSDASSGGTDISFGAVDGSRNTGAATETILFNFTYTLTITGTTTPGTGTTTLTGQISGTMGENATNLAVLNFAPQSGVVTTSGGETYDVSTIAPAAVGGDNFTTLAAHVTSRAIPEPGSLTLLGLGGMGVLGMLHRRRKAVAA